MLGRRSTCAVFLPILVATLFAGTRTICSAQTSGSRPTRVIQMVNVTARLDKTIDAKKNESGDAVTAKATEAATLSDGTQVPAGSVLIGHINSVTPSENKSDSILVFTFDKLAIRNGKEIPIKAVVVRVASFGSTFGGEQAGGDREANRPAADSLGPPSGAGVTNQPVGSSTGFYPISGLTLSGSANDATSATLTQSKKNIHLTNKIQLIVSVAALD